MKLEWENNKKAKIAILISVVALFILGIYQTFLTKP
jgi:hypothetical protein